MASFVCLLFEELLLSRDNPVTCHN